MQVAAEETFLLNVHYVSLTGDFETYEQAIYSGHKTYLLPSTDDDVHLMEGVIL